MLRNIETCVINWSVTLLKEFLNYILNPLRNTNPNRFTGEDEIVKFVYDQKLGIKSILI